MISQLALILNVNYYQLLILFFFRLVDVINNKQKINKNKKNENK